MRMDNQRADIVERNTPDLLAPFRDGQEPAQGGQMSPIRFYIDNPIHTAWLQLKG